MNFLVLLPVLIFSIVVHEVAHAWVAFKEGDDTAERLGRITLNPFSHLDLMGSFLVPVALYVFTSGQSIFGWAKPVPIDPRKFRNYRAGDIRVSLAGIVSNLLLAICFTILGLVLVKLRGAFLSGEAFFEFFIEASRLGVLINLILAVFNLIPIPPLDGSHVVYHLLPRSWGTTYRQVGRYGLLIIMGLVFFYPPFFSFILWPVRILFGFTQDFIDLWT